MSLTTKQTPEGLKDFLPAEAAAKRFLEDKLRDLIGLWGYQEIITPAFEYYDALALGDQCDLGKTAFHFLDRKGHSLALRPEMTTPTARLVATRLREEPLPLRLAYIANVFRYDEPQAGRHREFYQAGIELMGMAGAGADAEVVALAAQALSTVGLANFELDIGHAGFLPALLAAGGQTPTASQDLYQALISKDFVAFEGLVREKRLPTAFTSLILELPFLRGNQEFLLALAERIASLEAVALNAPAFTQAIAAIEELQVIMRLLEAYGVAELVNVDLGLIKDLDYYTGMVLEGYTRDLGFTICSGGRYDHLLNQFGFPCPATGWALGIERLLLALEKQGRLQLPPDRPYWLVVTASGYEEVAIQIAQRLRERHTVVSLVTEKETPALLAEARHRHATGIIIPAGAGQGQILAAADGSIHAGDLDELWGGE